MDTEMIGMGVMLWLMLTMIASYPYYYYYYYYIIIIVIIIDLIQMIVISWITSCNTILGIKDLSHDFSCS